MLRSSVAQALQLLSKQLKEEQYSLREVQQLVEEEFCAIPATAFSTELTPLETLTRYIEEEYEHLLGKPKSTIKQARENSFKKHPHKISAPKSEYMIPYSAFAEENISPMEALCLYLKDRYHLRNKEISELIGKDERTIWTVLNRGEEKRGEKQ